MDRVSITLVARSKRAPVAGRTNTAFLGILQRYQMCIDPGGPEVSMVDARFLHVRAVAFAAGVFLAACGSDSAGADAPAGATNCANGDAGADCSAPCVGDACKGA